MRTRLLNKPGASFVTGTMEIVRAAPAVAERYRQLETEADGGGPEEFLALVRRETPKWAEVVKRSGAKLD